MRRTWVVGLGLCLMAAAGGCAAEGDDDTTPRAGSGGGGGASLRQTLQRSVECQISAAGLGVMASECEGIDDFTTCLQSMCGLQDCESQCGAYATCLQGESDVCNNDCTASDACASCSNELSTCGTENCIESISCGPVTPGGPCDQLATCCAGLPEAMRANCEMFVPVGRAGGDQVCTRLMGMIAGCG